MKFEKFLKRCGTHGQIVNRGNGEKWLICDGVGMLVPAGVENLLGSGEVGEKTRRIVEALVCADTDDKVELSAAFIPAAGKPKDIVRIFGDNVLDTEVGISNEDFGLLEKSDVNLAEVELEIDDETSVRFLLVLDRDDLLIGFIPSASNK